MPIFLIWQNLGAVPISKIAPYTFYPTSLFLTKPMNHILFIRLKLLLTVVAILWATLSVRASSHREAPLIANDPLADNTDVYAFRSPDDPNTVTLIANYIPGQLAQGGPNYYSFGTNIRYEIHVDNDATVPGDEIIYRFTFSKTNQDPTTFFNIRLGAENLKTTYLCERSTDGGVTFQPVVQDGIVPPPNIGPRSIQSSVGLGVLSYETLLQQAIATATTGEKIYCGPVDDPFFVDLGGIFDLGDSPRQNGGTPRDGLSCLNVHSIAIQVPIATLQKDGKSVDEATSILDGDFVIGVWASASRPRIRTLNPNGTESYDDSEWVQVSRLGMPLTNEAVIPIGQKDYWNALTPYNEDPAHNEYFYNPELGLYMDDALFGGAVPAFAPLRIQRNSLQLGLDFGNGNDGLFPLKGSAAVAGTALDDAIFGTLLLPAAEKPRSVDLWPIFYTGVPNFPPYQLATGKNGNPLAAGKPFINNFLPSAGDMLRLNMATPVTDRDSPAFSNLGILAAAVAGLTDPMYNTTTDLQAIPNMDGFPNGRRLEDDVTRIELQAVAGIALAAIGLWYDDYTAGDANPVTQDLLDVLTYTTNVDTNDAPFKTAFPYMADPWNGNGPCGGKEIFACSTLAGIPQVTCQSGVTTEYSVTLTIGGGNAPFVISGDYDGTVQRVGDSFTFGPILVGSGYNVTITDLYGCSINVADTPMMPCMSLGIELVSFNGYPRQEGNLLRWTTASEINNAHFVLQCASDGQTFSNIATIKGKDNSSTTQNYQFLDKNATAGLSYYRLMQYDIDGSGKQVGVLSISRQTAANTPPLVLSQLYPNPAISKIHIQYIANITNATIVKIFDLSGKERYTANLSPNIGVNDLDIVLGDWQPGVYYVRIGDGSNMVVTKFMKN